MLLRSNAYRLALLQQFPGAAAAYSLRGLSVPHILGKLPVLRVRRSSDNDERDLKWWEITDGTLTTWTGAGNGFVRTWYDQSGNARHAQQATAENQPQIVAGGVLVTDGGQVAVKFDGVNGFLTLSIPVSGGFSQFAAFTNPTNTQAYITAGNLSGGAPAIIAKYSGTAIEYFSGTGADRATNITVPSGTKALITNLIQNVGGISTIYGNGILGATFTSVRDITSANIIRLGNSGAANHANTHFHEMNIYASNQSSNRAAIEANINAAWEIY